MHNAKIDTSSTTPIYIQVAEYFEKGILTGEFEENFRLPSVRDLALRLMVNPNTIVKAYQWLQDKNLIASQPGSGFKVTGPPHHKAKKLREQILIAAVDTLLMEAFALGYQTEEIAQQIHVRAQKLKKETK